MTEDIRQTLELNAKQVLDELERLKTSFTSYNDRLSTTANRLDSVTDSAKKTLYTLRDLRTEARLVEKAMGSIGMGTRSIGLLSTGKAGSLLGGTDASKSFDTFFDQCKQAQAVSAKTGEGVSSAFDRIYTASQTKFLPASKNVKAGTESMWLSWQTFARVIQTQLFVRGMNAVRDAFVESSQAALEFSSNVSNIRAINPERSFGEIAASVRVMSDSFNQSLETVSKAQLEVISDQFSDTADMVNILTAANKLAKATGEDLVPTAQLLTGALNAYGESAGMAEVRAAQFFKTIDLGRLKSGELATALGRVQSIGSSTGVGMEELDAALAAITIGGVKANEASTQLRGILVGLLKPTEAMQKALVKLGYDSGEIAVKTLGLQGALQALVGTTDMSTTSVAALFQNQRALAGVLRLVGTGAESYATALKEVYAVDQKYLSAKLGERMQTDAERLTKATNQLKNFWTAEFGANVVEKLNTVIQLVGGGNGLVGAFRNVTTTLPAMATSLAGLTVAAATFGTTADASVRQFNGGLDLGLKKIGSLRNAIGLVALFEGGYMLGSKVGEIIGSYITGPAVAARQSMLDNIAEAARQSSARLIIKQRETDEMIRLVRQQFADENVSYLRDTKNFEASIKAQETAAKSAFDRIMQHRRRMQSDLLKLSEEASKKATESIPKTIEGIERTKKDRKEQEWVEKTYQPSEQFRYWDAKVAQEIDAAAKLQEAAKDDNQEQKAKEAWERVEAYRQQSVELAKVTGNSVDLKKTEQYQTIIDDRRIEALQKQAQLQQQLAGVLEQRSIQAEKHTAELDSLRATIESQLATTVKTAEGGYREKTSAALRRDISQADASIAQFNTMLARYGKEDFTAAYLGDSKAFASLRRDAIQSLASYDIKTITAAPGAIATFQADLQESLDKTVLRQPVMGFLVGVTGLDPREVGPNAVIDDAAKRLKEYDARREKFEQGTQNMAEAQDAFGKTYGKTWKRIEAYRAPLGIESQGQLLRRSARLAPLGDLLEKLQVARADTDITVEELKGLQDAVSKVDFPATFGGWFGGASRGAGVQSDVGVLLTAITEISKAQATLKEGGTFTSEQSAEMEKVREALRQLEEKKQSQININENVRWELDAQGNIKGVLADENQLLRERAKLMQGDSKGMAFGGYFASGGFPRGFDTIPAMLSPGEFVVNAASASRFASQLVAINAGVQPAYRSEGGSVTNIGDINVSVTGGGTSRQTAREIANELQREIRRGTTRL